jgi:hypothetical protein
MKEIVFDEASHTYYVDGKKKPGVNEILKAVGLSKDWTGVDSFYRDRGVAVHKAIDLYLRGTLDESSIDPFVAPYFRQFLEWQREQKDWGGIILTERPFYSEIYDYCGTVDLIANGTIWDYKCSKSPDPVAELQGIGYRVLVLEVFGHDYPSKVLQLPGVGKAKVINYDGGLDLWDAVMKLYNWRKR